MACETIASSYGSQDGCIAPCQVRCAGWHSSGPCVLFSQSTAGWGVLLHNGNKGVGKVVYGSSEGRESSRSAGICANSDRRVKLLEEWERNGGDIERTLRFPHSESVVELL